jgi:hypothetical protein
MKKTIAVILVAVIAGLACPTVFARDTQTSAPTGLSRAVNPTVNLKVPAPNVARQVGGTGVIDDIIKFFGNVGEELRSVFFPK